MVDFNSDNTITTAPNHILKILILQRRNDVIEALEVYHKNKFQGGNPYTYEVKSRIKSLYYEIRAVLERTLKKEELEKLRKLIDSNEEKELLNAFEQIDDLLDRKKLTRIDSIVEYDYKDIEGENTFKLEK